MTAVSSDDQTVSSSLRVSVEVKNLRLVAKEAGDDDLCDVRSVGTPAANTHHAGGHRGKQGI